MFKFAPLAFTVLSVVMASPRAEAQTATPKAPPLVFGSSTVLSGPAADLGKNMSLGIELAFSEANARGGIGGRPLVLRALDDGYEPERCAPNMRRLVADKEVLGIIGNVGTPTAITAVPIAEEAKVLFYGAFTGAGVLRKDPPDRCVFNLRASYAEETRAMVDALIKRKGLDPKEIAFFTQRDGYGDAGFAGGMAALKAHGLKSETSVVHARYERNTVAVENAVAEILQAETPARAVIMVGAYAPCAAFIKLARALELDAVYLNVSFVGTRSLARELGAAGDGVIVTQIVPHPESDLPIARDYRAAAAKFAAAFEPDYGSLEGYAAARLLIRAVESIRGEVSRQALIEAMASLGKVDIGFGTPVELNAKRHQASNVVWASMLKDGKAVPVEWSVLEAKPVKPERR